MAAFDLVADTTGKAARLFARHRTIIQFES